MPDENEADLESRYMCWQTGTKGGFVVNDAAKIRGRTAALNVSIDELFAPIPAQ